MAKIRLPVIHFSRLPPLFCLSFGAFLGVLLAAVAIEARAYQKRSELIASYGDALVGLIAQNSADSMAAADMLGLHAVMQNAVIIPRVQLAEAYDADRVLLVQAGGLQSGGDYFAFSAPIPLHDSVTGHVLVTMDVGFRGDAAFQWVFLATVIVLLLMSLLALYEARTHLWYWPKLKSLPQVREGVAITSNASGCETVEAVDVQIASEAQDGGSLEADVWHYADLVVSLTNYQQLQSLLSDIVFSRRVSLFERRFEQVLDLYGGSRLEAPGSEGVYYLRFKHRSSVSQAVFSAMCAAFLIRSIDGPNKIKLHLLSEVCSRDADVKLLRVPAGLFLQRALLDDFLRERLVFDDEGGGSVLVTGFCSGYASLIEQQVERLSPSSGGV